MADFSVLIYTLENKSSSLNDYKKKLKSYSSKVQSIKTVCRLTVMSEYR